jgi:large repetitive protein
VTRAWLGFAVAASTLAQVTWSPETITTTVIPQAVINKNYSAQLMGSPGLTPAWSVAQGNLPNGLTLSASGVISGVATTLGANYFLVGANDPTYGIAYQALELDVVLGPLNIANNSLPIATVNVPYSVVLDGIGGVPPYKWSFATTVTEGMALDPVSGTLSGTPAAAGSFSIPIQVTDSIGKSFARGYAFFVAGPLTVLTGSLGNGSAGAAYSAMLTAGGGQAPYNWSATGLPQGLALNAQSGAISGFPAANGTSTVNINVTDVGARSASKALVLTIGPGVVVTNASLAVGMIGTAYSQTLQATGGVAPYTWAIAAGGSLPPGLSLNPQTGMISGTPTFGASLTFSVRATDSVGLVGLATYTINILPQLTILTTSLPPEPIGTAYSQAISATGGQTPYTWSATNLPAGLALGSSTGMLTGALTAQGSATILVTVTDALHNTASQSLVVSDQVPALPTISIGGLPTSPGYLQQPQITITLASPYSAALTGTFELGFVSSVGSDDLIIAFGTGGRSVTFTIPAGATQAQFNGNPSVAVLTGTTAGTITLTVSNVTSGGTNVTPAHLPTASITTNPTVPFVSTVAFNQTSGGVTAVITGFSSTRDMSSGTFVFTPSSNATLTTPTVTVSLASAFTTWYSSSASEQYGTQFTLTVPFGVQGEAGDLVAVNVTLNNSKGNSTSCSGAATTTTSCQ